MQSPSFDDAQPNLDYKFTLPISYKSKCFAAIGSVETNLENGRTFININHSPGKSSLSQLTFHCWYDWDWSYRGFKLAVVSIGI